MKFYWLLVGVLSVWRITHLFQAEDGPWNIIARLRRHAGAGFWGKLMDCFYCLSLWIAAPLACWLGEGWQERLLLWPSLSAGAILLERITNRSPAVPPALYIEHEEDEHAVLRTAEGQISRENSDEDRI
jgi:hypothetical protein